MRNFINNVITKVLTTISSKKPSVDEALKVFTKTLDLLDLSKKVNDELAIALEGQIHILADQLDEAEKESYKAERISAKLREVLEV